METLLGLICIAAPLVIGLMIGAATGMLPTISQSIRIAFEMLRLHKLRAILTMTGVVIGVMSVTLIVMVSNGFQSFLTSEFQKVGSDTIIVMYDRWSTKEKTEIEGLTQEDADYLSLTVPQLDLVAPILQVPANEVTNGDRDVKNVRIFASNENYNELNRTNIALGRQLDRSDMEARSNACVIGEEIAQRLFDNNALGKTLQIKGITLEVVGVSERFDIMGNTNARDVLLPLTTAQDKWIGGDTVTYITTRPKPGYDTKGTVEQVWQAMMSRSGNKKIYRVDSRESILQLFGMILGSAGALLSGIAGLSLLVGGIGIMNIMLVSVTERTREIGLRKAVGAKRPSILIQFLVEATVLSMIGGLIGMMFAGMIGLVITAITAMAGWPTKAGLSMPFPLVAAALALGFSACIGITFGFFPALSAAKLNPIDALRKE